MSNYKKLEPFKIFCCDQFDGFPFIEDTLDALTNYELLCKIVEYLNITNNNVDGIHTDFETIRTQFTSLKTWIEEYIETGLQDAVDTKLDEMASDGSLEQLIIHYVNENVERTYNSLELLKIADLDENIKVKTLGYYSINDGGGASYVIRTIEPDGYYETLNNGKYAEMIINNDEVNIKQFGTYGDSVHDDTLKIQTSLNICKVNNISNILIPDGEYKVTDQITIDFSNIYIKGNKNSLIKYYGTGKNITLIKLLGIDTDNYIKNITIDGLNIDGTNQTYKGGIDDEHAQETSTRPASRGMKAIGGSYLVNINIVNCNINDIYGDGIVFSKSHSISIKNNYLRNCSGGNPRSSDNFGDGITIFSSWNCAITGNSVINTRLYQESSTATDIGTLCGRSGVEYEYDLAQDGTYAPESNLFTSDDSNGLIISDNYVYGYTKGCHLENEVVASVINNTFIHNYIGCLTSSKGYTNITNNHFDNDNLGKAIQSGFDSYSGGLAITNYTDFKIYSEHVITNNIFKGNKPGINIAKDRNIISNNTFYITGTSAINSVTKNKNQIIKSNAFYNNHIYMYNSINWNVEDNIFFCNNTNCISGTTLQYCNFIGNIFYNKIAVEGTCNNINFKNNKFITDEDVTVDGNFITFYQVKNLLFDNNNINLSNNDNTKLLVLSSTSDGVNIINNVIKSSITRTNEIINLGAINRNLNIINNNISNINDECIFIKHVWEIWSASIEKNISDNPLSYIYKQTSGSIHGKFKQNLNNSKITFNGTPNSALSQFDTYYFNNGEILNNFNSNNSDFICNKSGYYANTTWANGSSYTANKLIKNSNNKVYKCITAGSGSSTVEPTHASGEVTENDGYVWKYMSDLCTFKQ